MSKAQDQAVWIYTTAQQAQILFLALGAKLKQQQQQPQPQRRNWEDFDEDDASPDELDSLINARLAASNVDSLKRLFLDRFAELLARKKDPLFVSAVGLVEDIGGTRISGTDHNPDWSASVDGDVRPWTLYVARNHGFNVQDMKFFGAFEEAVRNLACRTYHHSSSIVDAQRTDVNDGACGSLLDLMLLYCADRFEYHAHDLSQHPRQLHSGPDLDPFAERLGQHILLYQFHRLRKACAMLPHAADYLQAAKSIAGQARSLSKMEGMCGSLSTICSAAEAARTTRRIQFVARIPALLETVIDCVEVIPGLENLRIHPVSRPAEQKPTPVPLHTALAQARHLVRASELDMPDWLAQCQLRSHFGNEYRKKLVIHAEMQVMSFLMEIEIDGAAAFPYIGISKKTCFMCSSLLSSVRRFYTRPSHGKIYHQWTLPPFSKVLKSSADGLQAATNDLTLTLAKIICVATTPRQPVAESTMALSTQSQFPGNTLCYLHSHERRHSALIRSLELGEPLALDNHAAAANHHAASTYGSTDALVTYDASPVLSHLDPCNIPAEDLGGRGRTKGICGDPYCELEDLRGYSSGHLRCSACRNAWYCRLECQRSHWPRHKFECRHNIIDTADILVLDCLQNSLPNDPDVTAAFGLNRLRDSRDQTHLFGLYQGLLLPLLLHVSSRALHRWQTKGALVRDIKRKYKSLPHGKQGGHYPWFLRHTEIFDQPLVPINKIDNAVPAFAAYVEDVRAMMPEAYKRISVDELDAPSRKVICFYAITINGWHPDPKTYMWMDFGFCTCCVSHVEGQLGQLYRQLIDRCTFLEFVQAFKDHSLVSLFVKHDLGSVRESCPHLERYFEDFATLSVWCLRQYCEVGETAGQPAIWVDYGFMNCHGDALQKYRLKDLYSMYFERAGDPLALHEACIAGKLYEQVGLVVNVGEDLRVLMRNPYPLPAINGEY